MHKKKQRKAFKTWLFNVFPTIFSEAAHKRHLYFLFRKGETKYPLAMGKCFFSPLVLQDVYACNWTGWVWLHKVSLNMGCCGDALNRTAANIWSLCSTASPIGMQRKTFLGFLFHNHNWFRPIFRLDYSSASNLIPFCSVLRPLLLSKRQSPIPFQ